MAKWLPESAYLSGASPFCEYMDLFNSLIKSSIPQPHADCKRFSHSLVTTGMTMGLRLVVLKR